MDFYFLINCSISLYNGPYLNNRQKKRNESPAIYAYYVFIAFPLDFLYNNSSILGLSSLEDKPLTITATAGIFDHFF